MRINNSSESVWVEFKIDTTIIRKALKYKDNFQSVLILVCLLFQK